MRATYFAFAAALTLAGCGGMSTAISEYGGQRPVQFAHGKTTWRVYDKPETGRLMITPSLLDSFAAGTVSAATLGAAGGPGTGKVAGIPQNEFSDAAAAWIRQHGQNCRLTKGHILLSPQWEFFYDC